MVVRIPIAALGLGLLALSLSASAPARAQRSVYVVRAGDVLSRIAQQNRVSVEQLRAWNAIDGDRIQPGQELVTAPEPPPLEGIPYRIQRGDTLSHVALQYQTTLPELLRMNPGLRPDRIRDGQEIRVPEPENGFDYVLQPGETLSRIAERHEVTVRDLLRWNPRLDPDRVRDGQELRIYSDIPPSRSESIGTANRGSLAHPEPLMSHPAYVIRDPGRAYGTLETVRWIVEGFEAVAARFPDAPQVRIHDISDADGGPMRDHRSHQSGRDADISYFQTRCPTGVCGFRFVPTEELDVERQWALLETWLRNDRVEAVFIDYHLQRRLYEHARARGATRDELDRWFQYPKGPGHPVGIVRHYRRHRDHLHVRFVCPETDASCR